MDDPARSRLTLWRLLAVVALVAVALVLVPEDMRAHSWDYYNRKQADLERRAAEERQVAETLRLDGQATQEAAHQAIAARLWDMARDAAREKHRYGSPGWYGEKIDRLVPLPFVMTAGLGATLFGLLCVLDSKVARWFLRLIWRRPVG